ncbi:hypothetical protein SLA2020_445880 [Shorea laevis]
MNLRSGMSCQPNEQYYKQNSPSPLQLHFCNSHSPNSGPTNHPKPPLKHHHCPQLHRRLPIIRPIGLLSHPLLPTPQTPCFRLQHSHQSLLSLPHPSHPSFYIHTHMHRNSIAPNNYTFPVLLKSLSDFHDLKQGQCLHTHVIKLGHLNDIYVQNSLLDVYASCGHMGLCRRVFDEMPQGDVVSWTVLIMGYKNAGEYDDALIAFEQMQYAGVVPNRVTMVNALAVCANFGALEMGVWIHDFIKRSGGDWT